MPDASPSLQPDTETWRMSLFRWRFGGWAVLCLVLAAFFATVAGSVVIVGMPSVGTSRSVLLREARDRLAEQISALFAEQVAFERMIEAVPADHRAALIDELCRDNPRLWNIVISDKQGRITAQARPNGAIPAMLGELIVPIGASVPELPQLGRSADLQKTPMLIGVTSAIGGTDPALVTFLTRERDLPSAGASIGRSWLLTDDGMLLSDRSVDPAVTSALVPSHALRPETDRTVRVRLDDGEHRFMLRKLGGWPASVVMNAGLMPRPRALNDIIEAVTLGLLSLVLLLLGLVLYRRDKRGPAELAGAALSRLALTPPGQTTSLRMQRLASGIAHEINNLLTMVSLDAETVRALHPHDENVVAVSRSMLEAAGQGSELSQLLTAYAQRMLLQPQVINVSVWLRDHAAQLQEWLQPQQSLSFAGDEPECWVTVDPRGLLGCVGVLLSNAADASDPRGEIGLEITTVTEGGRTMLAIVVDDVGQGMPAALLEQAMEPGFSTKAAGHHLGLGLSAARGFAQQSGGMLQLVSEPGLGMRASVLLPMEPSRPARTVSLPLVPAALAAPPEKARVMSVLLVDDNDTVRASIARLLRLEGFAVQEAGTVEHALALLGPRVDIIVTDVVLKDGDNGWTLGARARAKDPTLPLLFISGFMTVRLPDLLERDDLVSFVRKPVGRAELVAVIDGLLALRQSQRDEVGRDSQTLRA